MVDLQVAMAKITCTQLFVDGAFLIQFPQYTDSRGFFEELYNVEKYPSEVPLTRVMQISCSSSKKNVIRGMHCSPYYKLVTCVSGAVYDYIVDLREDSPTYLKWVRVLLTDANKKQVFVPPGCGHGFFSMKENSLMVYAQGGTFDPKNDHGVLYRDPYLNISWPTADTIVSPKDELQPAVNIKSGLTVQPKRKRILIIGVSGKVGGALSSYLSEHSENMLVFGTHYDNPVSNEATMRFDLQKAAEDSSHVEEILDIICPDVVIICGAFTWSALCEKEKEKTAAVNVQGPANVAKYAAAKGIKVVAFSTDYVFDGEKNPSLGGYTEDETTNPLAEYGRSKLEMEKELMAVSKGKALILRTTTVNGPDHKQIGLFYNFYNKLKNNQEFPVSDVIRSPTYSKNLAEITTKLIEKDAEGIVNVCGDEFLRLPDFMRRVASAMKLNPDLVKETPRKSYQPAFSAMSSEKRRALLPDIKSFTVEEAVEDWMKTLKC